MLCLLGVSVAGVGNLPKDFLKELAEFSFGVFLFFQGRAGGCGAEESGANFSLFLDPTPCESLFGVFWFGGLRRFLVRWQGTCVRPVGDVLEVEQGAVYEDERELRVGVGADGNFDAAELLFFDAGAGKGFPFEPCGGGSCGGAGEGEKAEDKSGGQQV